MVSTAFYKAVEANAPTTPTVENEPFFNFGFSFGELIALKLPPREEIIFGLGRCEIGILNAVNNAGKTTLLRNLTVSLCTGKPYPPLGNFNLPKRVAFVDFEDTLSFLRQDVFSMTARLDEADKAHLNENAFFICDVRLTEDEDLSLSNPAHIRLLTNRLKGFKPDLIIVDTIASAFRIRNENDNAEVRTFVMRILRTLAKDCNAALIVAHHIGKSKSEEGQAREASHKGRGASSFADMSRLILNLEKDTASDGVILSCAKVKGQKFTDTILKLNFENRWFHTTGEKRESSNYELVLEVFDDKREHARKEIDDELDGVISKQTITRILSDAVKRQDLSKLGHGKYIKCSNTQAYRNEQLSIADNYNVNNTLQAQTKSAEKEFCPTCSRELSAMPNGELFCEICLYTKPN